MLTEKQRTDALSALQDPEGYARGVRLAPGTRRDVETWAGSGVAGDLSDAEVARLADEVIEDAHALGLRYGQEWGPMLNILGERDFLAYVDAALAG